MQLRSVLLGGTAAAAITISTTGIVEAQPRRTALASQQIGVFNWSGFYVGGHLGYGSTKTKGCFDCNDGSFPLAQSNLKLRGILGGLHAGYNWQRNNIVYGVEGDLSFMRFKKRVWDTPSTGSSYSAAKVSMLGSVRARLGIAVDRGLFYGTAGIAIPRAQTSVLNSGDSRTFKFNKLGGVVGLGYEWALTNNLSMRAEGLYYIFNETRTDSTFHSFTPGEANTLRNTFTFRLGLTYRFTN